jgi:hemerythrin-like metal-binding protein
VESHCDKDQDRLPTMRAAWEPDFSTGHGLVDAQHQGLLTQCNLLADLCDQSHACACTGANADEAASAFDLAYEQLKVLARAHFEAEAALLADAGYPDLEEHRFECDEFDYLAAEIVTAENFDRVELQRFLTLWCVGHVSSSTRQFGAYLVGAGVPA